jgi:cardiolipin synthase (CMP-forming)
VILAALGFDWSLAGTVFVLTAVVAVLTFLSVVFYVVEWVRHMNAAESEH